MTVAAGLVLLVTGAAPAAATDFCLDAADPNCPAGATIQADLETAMTLNGNDGAADRIFVPAEVISKPDSLNPNDFTLSDDLAVIGAGRESTVLTTSSSSNIYVINLAMIPNREVTMRDLTIRVPASFPDNAGSALQTSGDIFERVDLESRNPTATNFGSNAVGNLINGGTFRDVRVYGSEGGAFDSVFRTSGWNPGDSLEIEDSEFRDFRGGVTYNSDAGLPVHIRRSRWRSEYGSVLGVYNADSSIENSVIEAGEFAPFFVGTLSGSSTSATLTARNNTILNLGGAPTAFNVSADSLGSTGNAGLVLTDSIVFGFDKSWDATALVGAGSGDANLEISYNNLGSTGTHTGDGVVDASVGNISETPLFADLTDYRLSPDSPSIDAGNPAAGGLLDDFEGSVRPQDGNGDGSAIRDQGAYEAPKDPTCENTPELCPEPPPPPADTVAPRISKVKFRPAGKKAGYLRMKLSEAARIKATFKPVPKGKGKKRRKGLKLRKAGKAGANKLKIKKNKLKPGRYSLTIVATDPAGNRSAKVVRRVKVKPAK